MNKKKNKYDLGSFVKDNQQGLTQAGSFASGLLDLGINPKKGNQGIRGAQGALSGASAGMAFGPWGAAAGAVIGGGLGLINGGKEAKRLEAQRQSRINNGLNNVNANMNTMNSDIYGTDMYEEGGDIGSKKRKQKVIKGDGSILGNWGAKALNYLQSPSTENSIQNFQKKGAIVSKTAINIMDRTGITNYPDVYNDFKENKPLHNKLLDIAGAIPIVGGPLKVGSKVIKASEILPKILGTYGDIINGTEEMVKENKENKEKYQEGGPVKPKSPLTNQIKVDGGKLLVEKRNGNIGQWGNDIVTTPPLITDFIPQILPSDKAVGLSNTYYPSRNIQQGPSIPTQVPSRRYAKGGDILNNEINIEKGELLIDPTNKGKILQEYKGINPMTGGLYEPHAKKGKDTKNNFTIADPGMFIITKKAAPKYKDAVDNNDKITKETILANIRNAKVEKEGGLDKFADGGFIRDKPLSMAPYQSPTFNISQGTFNNGTPKANYSTLGMPIGTNAANTGFDYKAGLNTLNNYLPAVYNIGQGLFGNVDTTPNVSKIDNPYKDNILSNLPQEIDLTPAINDINAQSRVADQAIKNNVNSGSVYRANRQNLAANTAKQLSEVRMQKQFADNQVRGQRASIYGNLGAQDMAEQARVRDTNLGIRQSNNQAKAAKQNLLNTGLSQIQQITQNDKLNKQKMNMDSYSLQLLKQMYPSLNPYDMFSDDYIKKLRG